MTELSNVERIRQVGLSRNLSDDLVNQLAAIASHVTFPGGEIIFREHQLHRMIYWIVDGTVTLEMSPSHAGPKAVLTVGSGDLLAWSAFLGDQRMTTTAIASTDVHLVGFDSDEVRRLCDANNEIGYRFVQSVAEALSRRLVATRLQLLDLFE